MKTLFLSVLLVLETAIAHAQILDALPITTSKQATQYRQIVAKLQLTVMEIDWRDVSLIEAVADLRRQTNINFVVTKEASEGNFNSGALRLRKVSARLVLHFMKERGEIIFQFRHGTIFVTTKADAVKRGSTLRFYAIHDLLYVPPDFPAPKIGINPLPPGEADEEDVIERESHDPDRIIEIIKMATGPENWEFDSTSIQIHRGRMIVRHTPIMQRRVRYMIAALSGT